MRPQFSFANVMSVTAVILSLIGAGGGAYAALKLKANSVGSKQIKPDAAKGVDIDEASLDRPVPNATSATSAQSASTLGGLDSNQVGARAYGWVSAGTLDPNRSKNVTGVMRTQNKYCIALSPSIGPRLPALIATVVNPSISGTNADFPEVVWDPTADDCPSGQLKVNTWIAQGDFTDNGTGADTGGDRILPASDVFPVSFSFVVP